MRSYLHVRRPIVILLLFVLHAKAWAEPAPAPVIGDDPPVIQMLDGSKGQLKVDSMTTAEDAKFYNSAYDGLLKTSYPVKNMVSLEINEDANVPIPVYFDTWVKVEIKYWDANNNSTTAVTTLYNRYDTSTTYKNSHNYIFQGGFRVQVKVLEIKPGTASEVLNALKIVNQLQSSPEYDLSCADLAVNAIHDSAWAPNTLLDELPVYWAPSIGADEYDLEWTYVDDSALASGIYGSPTSPEDSLIFENNSTRVTISGTYYKIPLIYDNSGHLYFRVRSVQWLANGARTESVWSSGFPDGLGHFDFEGHERKLNWQATTTFAEDGKRKTVVQYFDGSLRTRQTVTKDNSTEKTIVAETIYDYQGRPVIQVLPAPTLNSVIGYSKNFNRGLNSAEAYDKSLFDTLVSADAYCNTNAPAMDTLSGAANYYSRANPLAQTGYHKYIPDAKGFPFTEVEYTQDNTGRISRQGGVGENFRIGSGHETKYMYGTADQRELDALFGTEAGYAQHYFKTSVRDANGQYSISYTDMHGRTVATALAGVPPDSIKLDTLSSYYSAIQTEKLSDPSSTVIKDWVMESKKSLLVTKEGNHTFTYALNPDSLVLNGCSPANICYECLYDLQITITDDCNNQKLPGGVAFDTVVRNFQIGAIDSCGNGGFSISFNKWLVEGSYEVTKKLSVSRYALDYYRDSVYMKNNTCKTIDSFIREQRELLAGVMECNPTCQGCTDSLGTSEQFRERYRLRAGLTEEEMAEFESMALASYNKAKEDCNELCGTAVSEYNDIRRNMLMDMTPSSGQYANIDNANDELSIFYYLTDEEGNSLVTAKYQQVTDYRDENGNLDMVYDEGVGKMVPPQDLSPEVFALKFKLSWAEALLPSHPEHCKLLRYEILKPSHEWDRRFEETDTYAEALAKGYLNPTRQSNAPASIGTTGTDIADPLKAHYSDALSNALSNYRALSGSAVSMWSVATISAMCKEGGNSETCFQNYDNINEAFNPATMCEAELDMAWRAFRQMYLDVKRGIINKQWITGGDCGDALSATALMARGFSPNFGDAEELNKANNAELPQNTAQVQSEIQGQMTDYYAANCDAYINQWVQQLSGCPHYPADSIRKVIIPRLIQVCREGSDQSHSYGASSVKPSSNLMFRNFEEVIEHYNQTHGITDRANCNVYKITAPKPYDQQAAFGNKPTYSKPEDCECDLIASYYDKYKNASGYSSFSEYMRGVYKTIISDSLLNLLLGLCEVQGRPAPACTTLSSPIFIPPAFQCYSGDVCISCEQFAAADSAFRVKYPGASPVDGLVTDSLQIKNNLLYEAFLNHRFGYAKTLTDYLIFSNSCGLKQYTPPCVALQNIKEGYLNSAYGEIIWGHYRTAGPVLSPAPTLAELFQNGYYQMPARCFKIGSAITGITIRFRKMPCDIAQGYTFETRLKFPFNSRSWSKNDFDFGGPFYATILRQNGITKIYQFRVNGSDILGGQVILDSTTGLNDWRTVKCKVTPSKYYIYFDNKLVKEINRNSAEPITAPANFMSFRGDGFSIDWVKYYNSQDQLVLFEDFNTAQFPAHPEPGTTCPAASTNCTQAFANYFNQQRGTNYTYSQIDSLYNADCGQELLICNTGSGANCDTLQDVVKGYNFSTNPYRVRVSCQANPMDTTFTNLQDIVDNGYMAFPGYVREDLSRGWMYHRFGIPGTNFCWSNGYTIETRLKTLRNVLNAGDDEIYFTTPNASAGFVIARRSNSIILRELSSGGSVIFTGSVVIDNNPAALYNDWNVIKIEVTPGYLRFYYNGSLKQEAARPAVPLTNANNFLIAFFSYQGAIDWLKMYDANGNLKYHEDFDDNTTRAIVDPSFLCPVPATDCEAAFTNYFNQQSGTKYNYEQIRHLYRNTCGMSLKVCAGVEEPTLCGRAEPLFPPMVLEEINNCSDSSFFITSKAQELHKVYLDSLKGHFDSAYIARCLEAYKHEKFEVRHTVNEFHHTLYYYDQAGNLIKTVPPAGVCANYDSLWLDSVALARDAGNIKVPVHELVTQYRYNTLNQVVASNSPDGGLAEFWYDRLGRLAISRNARQRTAGATEAGRQYSYTWYDNLGRIVEVGQVSNTSANGPMTNIISKNAPALRTWLGNLSTRRSQYIATWYDDAPIPPSIVGKIDRRNMRNRVSHTYYADTGNYSLYASAIYYTYDILGNVDTLLQDYGSAGGGPVQNMMNVSNNRWKKIAYNYDLVSGKVNRVTYQPGLSDQWIHRYTYDAENRLTLVETSTDNLVWEKDARYEYYRHGPLARVTLGHQQVQAMDYAYTLQGWLKGINSTSGTAGHDMGEDGLGGSVHQYTARDALGLTLNYFTGDYGSISNVNPFPGYSGHMPSGAYRPLYNGNISSLSIYQKKFAGANPLIFYNYKYDQLNRLTGQDAYKGFSAASNNWEGLSLMDGKLTERISYDGNGNIQTYERRSMEGTRMDSLEYAYYAGTNRLSRVFDHVAPGESTDSVIIDINSQAINNYIYDSIGNLAFDASNGNSRIYWNVYGKITRIERSATAGVPATSIYYEYDALGNRIGQTVVAGTNRTYTWYVRDAQGNILSTYTAEGGSNLANLNVQQQDRYIYGSSRLGSFSLSKLMKNGPVAILANRVDTFTRGYREYELANHLGNVLATISDKKFGVFSDTNSSLIDHYEPDIVSATDYYPFGMPSRVSLTDKGYRFGFNGQEMSNDIKGFGNSYTAEFWEYDSRIGRRWNRDPIIKVSESPYLAFGNNPVMLCDPNGADTINITRTTTRVKGGMIKSNLDGIPSIQIPDRITKTGDISITAAEGNDIFRITDVSVTVDENGNITRTSNTTTLDLNNPQTFNRTGGHNMKGYIDDRYALAANTPDWLLKHYADKSGDIGIRSALAYQKDVPFAAGLNKIANVAYLVSGMYGIARVSLSRAAIEAFPSGFVTSQVEGFYMRSASSMTNGVYQKTIQTLAYTGENSAGSMLKVLRSVEAEARAAGAKSLEIHGVEIVNTKILSTAKAAAEKFGYTFEQVTTNSIKLAKQLK